MNIIPVALIRLWTCITIELEEVLMYQENRCPVLLAPLNQK